MVFESEKDEREYRQSVIDNYCLGYNNGRDITIEKACEWIPKHIQDYIIKDKHGTFFVERQFIEDFKKKWNYENLETK